MGPRLLSLGLVVLCASAAPGRPADGDRLSAQTAARALDTAAPVYKAFGLNASGERLAYRPLAGDAQ